MYVAFVEYVIFHHCKSEYLEFITRIKKNNPNMELLESTDQSGLFLEVWKDISYDGFIRMQKERLETTHSTWTELQRMVDHNKQRIRTWCFSSHIWSNES
jgi:hypothetical protein